MAYKRKTNVEKQIKSEGLPELPQLIDISLKEKKQYLEIARKLASIQELNNIEGFQILNLTRLVIHYQEAYELLMLEGMIQKFKNGTRNFSPEFSAFLKLEAVIRKGFKEIIKETSQKTAVSTIDELLNSF